MTGQLPERAAEPVAEQWTRATKISSSEAEDSVTTSPLSSSIRLRSCSRRPFATKVQSRPSPVTELTNAMAVALQSVKHSEALVTADNQSGWGLGLLGASV